MTKMLILSASKIPKRTFLISNLIALSKELSTTFNSCQNVLTFVQWKKRCSMVSSSFSQKSHKGETAFLNLNSILGMLEVQRNGMREGKVQRHLDGKCERRDTAATSQGLFYQLSRNEMLLFELIPISRCKRLT